LCYFLGILLRCSVNARGGIAQAAGDPAIMLVFAIRRLLQAIPILLGVSLVVFGLVHIVPGNPIDMLMPPEASPEVIAQMKAAFGFDKPLYIQYLLWLWRALQGNFGVSVFNASPVWGQLITALGNTFLLAIGGALLGFSMGSSAE
jgi:peptide/nickel transport system permease protein